MDLSSNYHSDVNIVTVNAARIDASVAIKFKDEMRAAVAEGPTHVVLDLSNVAFVDSSGLGAIVAAMKQMGPARKLDLAGLTPDVAKVFHLTRMDTVFDIHDSADTFKQRAAG